MYLAVPVLRLKVEEGEEMVAWNSDCFSQASDESKEEQISAYVILLIFYSSHAHDTVLLKDCANATKT